VTSTNIDAFADNQLSSLAYNQFSLCIQSVFTIYLLLLCCMCHLGCWTISLWVWKKGVRSPRQKMLYFFAGWAYTKTF